MEGQRGDGVEAAASWVVAAAVESGWSWAEPESEGEEPGTADWSSLGHVADVDDQGQRASRGETAVASSERGQ